jgi:hypothetical protein
MDNNEVHGILKAILKSKVQQSFEAKCWFRYLNKIKDYKVKVMLRLLRCKMISEK